MPVITVGHGVLEREEGSALVNSSKQEICGFEGGNLMFSRWAVLRGGLECSPDFISCQFQKLILFREMRERSAKENIWHNKLLVGEMHFWTECQKKP